MVKIIKFLILTWMVGALAGCAPNVIQFSVHKTEPRAIYAFDQVRGVWPNLESLKAQSPYLEVRTLDGARILGFMTHITRDELQLKSGFYYKTVRDSIVNVDYVESVELKNIVTLKIW